METVREKIIIPYRPRFPQTIIHPELERHRFNLLVAHRRTGKSVLEVNRIIKAATLLQKPFGRYAYIAPFLKQAKRIAWDYLKRYSKPIPMRSKPHESELYIEIPNCYKPTAGEGVEYARSRIELFGADRPDSIRGTYFDGVVLDEYAQIKPELWGEVIRPLLSDRMGWADFTGTPKGQNDFYEKYELALRLIAQGNKNWWVGVFRADETGVIPPEELEEMRAQVSEAQFRQEFLCDWTASADNILITIDIVLEAMKRHYNTDQYASAAKVIGVDPARFGDDRTVIFKRQGLVAFNPITLKGLDNIQVSGRLIQEIKAFDPDAVFIDSGAGAGIIDFVRSLGHYVTEVNFGGKALDQGQYLNKRAEMWDLMGEWIRTGGLLPNIAELKADLVAPSYKYDTANRLVLEPKDKIKERLGRSPDTADALALTFAYPVAPKSRLGRGQMLYASGDYDPFKN